MDIEDIGLPVEQLSLSLLARSMEKTALSAATLAAARKDVNTSPSKAQQDAGNYAKGHIAFKGLQIAIENPKGSTRSGVGADGKKWSTKMRHDYGYIKGTVGRDKDHLDIFMGPDLDSELVHVINQVDTSSKKFDEHKIILGATNLEQAKEVYLANYEDGWQGCGSVRQLSLQDFKDWLQNGDTSKKADDEIKVPVPSVRQETGYTCGPAALEAATAAKGDNASESDLAAEAGSSPEKGTPPMDLLETAKEHGFQPEAVENMGIEALKNFLDDKVPVLVALQAWGDPEDYDDLDDGHYVLAIGYDDENIYFEDPTLPKGTDGYIPDREFEKRWKDKEYAGKVYNRLGIVLYSPDPDRECEDVEDPQKIAALHVPVLGRDKMEAMKQDPHPSPALTSMGSILDIKNPKEKKKRRKRTKRGAATGIPDRRNYGDLAKLTPGELADFVIQEHNAQRAGRHYDVRFGRPDTGLFSWATKKELPEPGQRTALFQQPVHSHGYMNFQGTLKGYGAGTVRQKRKGQILVTNMSPGKIEFTTADERYPERFALIKPQTFEAKSWLLINTTPRERVPYEKVHMTSIPTAQVEETLKNLSPDASVQAKIDGASSLIKLLKDGVEVTSYRTSKVNDRPIVHTERVFHTRPKGEIPKDLVGSVLKGELYGQRPSGTGDGTNYANQEAIDPQELGGLLNSSVAKSIASQKAKNVQLRIMLHDIQQRGQEHVDYNTVPYENRMQMIQDILPQLPGSQHFEAAESARGPEAALALWNSISSGKHPLTHEGIVIHPSVGKPMKGKLTSEQDVHVTGTFPGEGKYQGVGVGGLEYALQPGGPAVGRVGTGLSDDLRKELFNDPNAYVGRVARIRAQEQHPSGAYRAPSFLSFHEG